MTFHRLLLSALCALCFGLASVKGQQSTLSVKGFQQLPNDQTAMLEKRTDQNGNQQALIKVRTLEKGFQFSFGAHGHASPIQKTGEIWVYTPPRMQKVTISHKDFGLMEYYFPESIESGRTYEMLLDIGTGRFISVLASDGRIRDAEVIIDDEYVGKAPLYNRYVNFGKHHIEVVQRSRKNEGELTVFITPESESQALVYNVDLQDVSGQYGTVSLTVANQAEIWFGGRRVATGAWQTELRQGTYEVETRKLDCEPARTQLVVVGGQATVLQLRAPEPHVGTLRVYTRPRNVETVYNGNHPIDLLDPVQLPIGSYQVAFRRKGYVSQNHEYRIGRNEIVADTVTLERISYLKRSAFYFGGALSVRSLMGLTGILGVTYDHHDVQASYTFGLSESKVATMQTNPLVRVSFKMSTLALRYGYQFAVLPRIGLTPQLGYAYNRLSGTVVDGNSNIGDGSTASSLLLGLKVTVVPMQHVYGFLAPEFGIAMGQNDQFKAVADRADLSAGGFALHAGILVNF